MNICTHPLSHRPALRIVCVLLVAVLATVCTAAQACWQEAAERYNINPHVLMAIAKCESSLNPAAMNRSHYERTGTYDIGLMQINSSNLRGLSAMGIGERELLDACTNINVGAWILAQKVQRYGNSWEAVGAYNAACSQLKGEACTAARNKYARCVYKNLPPELKGGHQASQQAAAATAQEPAATSPGTSPATSAADARADTTTADASATPNATPNAARHTTPARAHRASSSNAGRASRRAAVIAPQIVAVKVSP